VRRGPNNDNPCGKRRKMTTPREDDPRLFAPGTHGGHEALHVALMFAEIIDETPCPTPGDQSQPRMGVAGRDGEESAFCPLSSDQPRASRARSKAIRSPTAVHR
jgi:hypothetical protein